MRPTAFLFWLATALCCRAAGPAPDRATRWREDLVFFERHFTTGHCGPKQMIQFPLTWVFPCHQADFTKLYDAAAFHAEIAALEAGAGELSDAEISLRLMKLVARAHVGHTFVGMPRFAPFHRLPVQLGWFAEGLAVTGADPQYAKAIGARVLRVGRLEPDALLAAAAPYISYENDAWLRTASPNHLSVVEVLAAAGAMAAGRSDVDFTLARPGGAAFTVTVAPGNPQSWKMVGAGEVLHIPTPLYRKNPDRYYWYEYLAEAKTLYIQYNRCANDPKQRFGDFARGVLAFADAHPVARTVIDLRFNGGGNSLILHSLQSGLKARAALRDHVVVLIGPGTFSAAQDNAIELRRELHATLVGEATGERPNGYGEVKWFRLPHARLFVQYSTRYQRMVKDGDPSALEPDVRAARTLEDALAGRDAALEAAMRQIKP